MAVRTPYEESSLLEVKEGLGGPLRTPVSALLHLAAQGTPPARTSQRREHRTIAEAVRWMLGGLSDRAARSLRVRVRRVALWEADEGSAGLAPRYAALGVLLGLAAGGLRRAGAGANVPLVAFLGLRVIHEHAAWYGFDPHAPHERAFAARLLAAALAPSAALHDAPFDDLVRAGARAARRWRKDAMVRAGVVVALAVARRLPRSAGGLALAAVDAWLLAGVARAARSAYRARRLTSG